MIHIWHPLKLSNFQDLSPRPPTLLFIYVQNSSSPLTVDVQFQTNPSSPLQVITNQLKPNIIQEWPLYVTSSFPQVGFRFQYQLINLVWLSFLCLVFLLTSFHRACEQAKSKRKQNQVVSYLKWPRVLLFDIAHKQGNDVIKEWLHCLTSRSNGRSLVNNILIFGSTWYLVTAQIQFSLINKIKIGCPEHSLTHHPPTSSDISFLPYPSTYPLPQSGRNMCITTKGCVNIGNCFLFELICFVSQS